MRLEDIFDFIGNPVLATTATAITAVVLALLVHTIATTVLRRIIQRHTTYLHVFLKGAVAPTRLLLPMLVELQPGGKAAGALTVGPP